MYGRRHKNVRVSVPLNGRSTGPRFHNKNERKTGCPFPFFEFRSVFRHAIPCRFAISISSQPLTGVAEVLRVFYAHFFCTPQSCRSATPFSTLSIVSLAEPAGSARLVHCCPGHERSPRAMRSVSK